MGYHQNCVNIWRRSAPRIHPPVLQLCEHVGESSLARFLHFPRLFAPTCVLYPLTAFPLKFAQTLTAVGGSGVNVFSSNDSSLSILSPATDALTVGVTPLRTGTLIVTVRDTGILNTTDASAVVAIAHAKTVHIAVQSLVCVCLCTRACCQSSC